MRILKRPYLKITRDLNNKSTTYFENQSKLYGKIKCPSSIPMSLPCPEYQELKVYTHSGHFYRHSFYSGVGHEHAFGSCPRSTNEHAFGSLVVTFNHIAVKVV